MEQPTNPTDLPIMTGLTPLQADGLACVRCGKPTMYSGRTFTPVGRSASGSQVFACGLGFACVSPNTAAPAPAEGTVGPNRMAGRFAGGVVHLWLDEAETGIALDSARAEALTVDLVAVTGYTPPAEMDRTHPDGVKVGDPVPDGIDPGCHPMNQCRVNSPSSAAGWHRCDRSDAKHVTGGGQHVALGPANANGTGDLVVVAVWPAGTGWTSA